MTFRLEDQQGAFLDAPCMDILGDSIAYQTVGGALLPMRGYVDFTEQMLDIATGQAIAQDITVEVRHADVPVRPSAQCRVTIARLLGKTFRPVNVRNSADGNHWIFELEKISG